MDNQMAAALLSKGGKATQPQLRAAHLKCETPGHNAVYNLVMVPTENGLFMVVASHGGAGTLLRQSKITKQPVSFSQAMTKFDNQIAAKTKAGRDRVYTRVS
jgi:hypothetical protein